jgi:hypothetical protein
MGAGSATAPNPHTTVGGELLGFPDGAKCMLKVSRFLRSINRADARMFTFATNDFIETHRAIVTIFAKRGVEFDVDI